MFVDSILKVMISIAMTLRKSVTSLKELYSSNEKNEDNIVPMLSSNGQIELFALYDEIADIENDNDEPIILNTPNKDGESTGVITDAIFISNNSDNKEKALEFYCVCVIGKGAECFLRSEYRGISTDNLLRKWLGISRQQ